MDEAAKGRERQGWELDGGAHTRAAAAAAYISQCTQRMGHLIYIEPHGSSCSVVFTVVHMNIYKQLNNLT